MSGIDRTKRIILSRNVRGNIQNFRMCISPSDVFSLKLEMVADLSRRIRSWLWATPQVFQKEIAQWVVLLHLMYHGHSSGMEIILIRAVSKSIFSFFSLA